MPSSAAVAATTSQSCPCAARGRADGLARPGDARVEPVLWPSPAQPSEEGTLLPSPAPCLQSESPGRTCTGQGTDLWLATFVESGNFCFDGSPGCGGLKALDQTPCGNSAVTSDPCLYRKGALRQVLGAAPAQERKGLQAAARPLLTFQAPGRAWGPGFPEAGGSPADALFPSRPQQSGEAGLQGATPVTLQSHRKYLVSTFPGSFHRSENLSSATGSEWSPWLRQRGAVGPRCLPACAH